MTISNLAGLLQDKGEHVSAEPLCRRALAIIERAHGPDHRSTGISLSNLARVLQDLGELEEAELLAQRAVAIIREPPFQDHFSAVYARALVSRTPMLRGGADATEGRGAIEEAVRVLAEPPHSFPHTHTILVRMRGWLVDATGAEEAAGGHAGV